MRILFLRHVRRLARFAARLRVRPLPSIPVLFLTAYPPLAGFEADV